ncbi:Uncharacterised protein [Mycobacteroides abscessus subsp. abscessus]|nr:Uncharacterised protein [Mycobacteroides abscessus subsp. abscessus]
MGAASTIERVARLRVPLPQRVVGLTVDALDGLPLVEDRAQPIARGLPLGGFCSDGFRLGGEFFFARDGCGASLFALGLQRVGDVVGTSDDDGQSLLDGRDVADHAGLGEGVEQMFGCGLRLARIAGACGEALFENLHLCLEVGVSTREMGETLVDGSRLPRPDLTLTVRGDEPDDALFIDPPELAGIERLMLTDGNCRNRGRCLRGRFGSGTGPRAGLGTWLRRAGPGAGSRLGCGCGRSAGVVARHGVVPSQRQWCRASRLPVTTSCATGPRTPPIQAGQGSRCAACGTSPTSRGVCRS